MLKTVMAALAAFAAAAAMAEVPCRNCGVSSGNVIYKCRKGHVICTKCMDLSSQWEKNSEKLGREIADSIYGKGFADAMGMESSIGKCTHVNAFDEKCGETVYASKVIADNRSPEERNSRTERGSRRKTRREIEEEKRIDEEVDRAIEEEAQEVERDRQWLARKTESSVSLRVSCDSGCDRKYNVFLFIGGVNVGDDKFDFGNPFKEKVRGAIVFGDSGDYENYKIAKELIYIDSSTVVQVYGRKQSLPITGFPIVVRKRPYSSRFLVPRGKCRTRYWGVLFSTKINGKTEAYGLYNLKLVPPQMRITLTEEDGIVWVRVPGYKKVKLDRSYDMRKRLLKKSSSDAADGKGEQLHTASSDNRQFVEVDDGEEDEFRPVSQGER